MIKVFSRRDFMKGLAVGGAALGSAGLLAACGSSSSSTTQETSSEDTTASEDTATQEITNESGLSTAEGAEDAENVIAESVAVGIGYDIATLEPWGSATSGRLLVMPSIYEYMAYYDSDSDCGMIGILMKEYEKVDEFTSRVTIYDYIYDSAGNWITAEDVAFSFNTWKNNGKSTKCKLLEECTAVDDFTVDITLNQDTVGDVENMLCGLVPIVAQAAYEADENHMMENVVSTAPYIVSEFVSGSRLTVVKNENYWQTDETLILPTSQANAEEITWYIITESSQMSTNLETNAVDMVAQLSTSEVSRFEDNDDYTVFPRLNSNFYWMTFNCAEGAMFADNVALRQAICYAVDTSGLVTGVLSGRGEVSKAYGNPECVDYNEKWDSEEYYEYDLDTAKALLEESGFDKSTPIRIMITSGSVNQSTATIIQSYLIDGLGLNAEILNYESALFQTYKTESGEWDIMIDSKQSLDYVSSLASSFQVSGDTQAMNFVQDDTLQEMVVSVQTNAGHTEEAIDEYMQYLKDQCYVYALFRDYTYDVAESTVSGVFRNFKGWLVPGACTFTADFER